MSCSATKYVVGVVFTILCIGGAMVFATTPNETIKERIVDGEPARHGEGLYTKLNADKVQVVFISKYSPLPLGCRVLCEVRIRDGILSKESMQTNYTIVWFAGYELTRQHFLPNL